MEFGGEVASDCRGCADHLFRASQFVAGVVKPCGIDLHDTCLGKDEAKCGIRFVGLVIVTEYQLVVDIVEELSLAFGNGDRVELATLVASCLRDLGDGNAAVGVDQEKHIAFLAWKDVEIVGAIVDRALPCTLLELEFPLIRILAI